MADQTPAALHAQQAAGRDVWERLPGEGDKAYAAFLTYRDMGPSRSLQKTAKAHGKKGQTFEAERTWSRKFAWGVRVRAWEDEQARLRDAWISDERKKATERHVRTAQALQSKAIQALQSLQPSQMTPSEVIRFAEVAIRLEREALTLDKPIDLNVTVTQAVDGLLPEEVVSRLRVLRKEIDRRVADHEEDEDIQDAEVVE